MPKGDTYVCRRCKETFALCKNAKGFYCSTQCQKDYEWEQKKKKILAEGRVPNSRTGRRFLLERDGNVCQFPGCGCREWNGKPAPLILDHIDGNPENWALTNLRLICPNCDGLTETYKNRNRGRGRHVLKAGKILPTHPPRQNGVKPGERHHAAPDESPPQADALQQLEQQLAQLKEELDQQLLQTSSGSKAG